MTGTPGSRDDVGGRPSTCGAAGDSAAPGLIAPKAAAETGAAGGAPLAMVVDRSVGAVNTLLCHAPGSSGGGSSGGGRALRKQLTCRRRRCAWLFKSAAKSPACAAKVNCLEEPLLAPFGSVPGGVHKRGEAALLSSMLICKRLVAGAPEWAVGGD